jgi:hypothetical protein
LGSIFGKWKSIYIRAIPLDVVFFEMMELTFPIHGPIIYVPSIQMSLHFLNSLGSHFGFPPTFLTPPLDDVFFEGVSGTKQLEDVITNPIKQATKGLLQQSKEMCSLDRVYLSPSTSYMDAPKLNTPIAVGGSQSTHHPYQQLWMGESSIGVSKDLNMQGTSISAIAAQSLKSNAVAKLEYLTSSVTTKMIMVVPESRIPTTKDMLQSGLKPQVTDAVLGGTYNLPNPPISGDSSGFLVSQSIGSKGKSRGPLLVPKLEKSSPRKMVKKHKISATTSPKGIGSKRKVVIRKVVMSATKRGVFANA